VRDADGRLVGIAPLYCGAADGVPILRFVGGVDPSDYLDFILARGREPEAGAAIFKALATDPGWHTVDLYNVPEASPTRKWLPQVAHKHGWRMTDERQVAAPLIELPTSFDAYLSSLDKRERHELRRKLRRAEEAEPRPVFRVTGSADELSRDFPSFLELHRRSHPEKRRFMDDRMAVFFREVADGFLSAGLLRLAFLRGAEGDIAAAFQIETDGALLLYNSGFDPAAGARWSPGMVLLARCIEDAIRTGVREYDFLRGRERYKYDLGGRDRTVYRAVLSLP
jgi:CelD/BcsL family acetyltransferase involved in cellulose biosynthesis